MALENIRTLKVGEGDPGAQSSLGASLARNVGQGVPTDSPYGKFGSALMDLLKQYQGMGTAKFREAELSAQERMGRARYEPLPSDVAGLGLSPAQIGQVRGARVGAMEPEVKGAGALRKTFTEQLTALGDALSQARAIGQFMLDSEQEETKQAIDWITKFPGAVQSLDSDQKKALAKKAGVDPSFIDLIEPEIKAPETKVVGKVLLERDPKTGQWKEVYRQPSVLGEDLTPAQISNAFKLTDDYEKASKTFTDQVSAYTRVQASATTPSAAGDLALIFNYMKMLAPSSVVREGEFATAVNTGSIPQIIWAKYNKILKGERLSDSMRQDFVDRSRILYDTAVIQQTRVDTDFRTRGQKLGIPEELYMRNLFYQQTGTSGQAPDIGSVVEKDGVQYRKIEGGYEQVETQPTTMFGKESYFGRPKTTTESIFR